MSESNFSNQLELYSRIAQGDSRAFGEVHALYKTRLLYYGKHFLAEWYEVEDVVADAFLALWVSREQIHSNDHLRNFLFITVRHKAIDRQRTRERQGQLLQNLELPATTEENKLEAELVRVEMIHLLSEAVDALPAKYQRIFELAYHLERSPAEIAQILQMNPDTVRSQKRRAIEMIRNWIKEKTIFILLLYLPVFTVCKNIFHFLAR